MNGGRKDAERADRSSGTTVAWYHCFAGIAGDMALGALLDAGADLGEVLSLLRRLPLSGWSLRAEPVLRGGIAGTRAIVDVADTVVVRTHSHIVGLLEEARLPQRLERRALDTFRVLAEVEGRLHRRSPDQVHFHELGSHDTIIDVVGTAAALEVLDVDEVSSSAVTTGTGTIRTSHGFLPNPSPATVQLLRGIPTQGHPVTVELTTPTGAAILAAMGGSFGPMPAMRISASGFGAGAREIDGLPNCTQVVLGSSVAQSPGGQTVLLLEANLDDATGEVLAHAVESLLESGAHDAWVTPVVMKKGRPGHVVSALADAALAEQVRRVLQAETGSLGVRGAQLERWPSPRSLGTVEIEGMPVRVKVSPGRVKVEQHDAARVASRTGIPLREVLVRAEVAWRRRSPWSPGELEGEEPGQGATRGTGEPEPDGPTPA